MDVRPTKMGVRPTKMGACPTKMGACPAPLQDLESWVEGVAEAVAQ